MKGVEATATLNTSGSVDATCGRRTLTKGLVAKLEASTASSGGCSEGLTFDFKQELFTAKASYEVYKGDAHAAQAAASGPRRRQRRLLRAEGRSRSMRRRAVRAARVHPVCQSVGKGKPAGMTFAGLLTRCRPRCRWAPSCRRR